MKDDFTTVKNYRTNEYEKISISGLLNLANAIIIRACIDYTDRKFTYRQFGIEQFLKSEYAQLLMRGCCNSEKIIKHLRGD